MLWYKILILYGRALNSQDFTVGLDFLAAYRIHVNISTVTILQSMNEGYKIEVRGKTELKVQILLIQFTYIKCVPLVCSVHTSVMQQQLIFYLKKKKRKNGAFKMCDET